MCAGLSDAAIAAKHAAEAARDAASAAAHAAAASALQTAVMECATTLAEADAGCPAAPHRFACPTCASEYDAETSCITPDAYAEHARVWVDAGASVVGGCCGVGPAHLKAVREGHEGSLQGWEPSTK